MAHYPQNVGEFLLKEATVSNQVNVNIGINEYECQPNTIINLSYTGQNNDLMLFSSDKVGIFYDIDTPKQIPISIKDHYLVTVGALSKIHVHVIVGLKKNYNIVHLVANAQTQQISRSGEVTTNQRVFYVFVFGDDLLEVTFMRYPTSNDTLSYLNSYYLDGESTEMTSEKEEYTVLNTNFVILKIMQQSTKHNGLYGIKEVKGAPVCTFI
ncbi:hypothetical protein TVAG_082440 [Trichomonas vaginalis G3]|uniref:Uncharacterized protein n=1 Tax=Trichomonas vaginalis (strain ATCC PRA-98 / G3) TaxID=412133 RepID=A2FP81_TRIV3|nr:hypothetical protein TVAG_082440 [Trichomonas vaginalis G3]|eukprot:XP_001306201.1 hypothetical protein [Trichomonas vaginalis G3]